MNDETIRNNVIEILKKDEQARKSDNVLIIKYLLRIGCARMKRDEMIIDLKKFDYFPAFESIRRVRQQIQNTEGLYEPDEEVKEIREEKRKEFKQKYSPKNKYAKAENFPNSQLSL